MAFLRKRLLEVRTRHMEFPDALTVDAMEAEHHYRTALPMAANDESSCRTELPEIGSPSLLIPVEPS